MGNSSRKTSRTSLKIIESIAELGHATLTEISEFSEIPTSTLYTHLQTLEREGFIIKNKDEYCLSMKMFHLGEKARRRDKRYQIAKEEAWKLSDEVGEEVSFAIEENDQMIIVYDETTSPSNEGFQLGRYFDMHSSASGKATMAEFSNERIKQIIQRHGLERHTENTITAESAFFDEIQQIRKQGYAVNNQEEVDGLRAVAVAVSDQEGELLGTLDIAGPPYRLPDSKDIAAKLREAVERIEERIDSSDG